MKADSSERFTVRREKIQPVKKIDGGLFTDSLPGTAEPSGGRPCGEKSGGWKPGSNFLLSDRFGHCFIPGFRGNRGMGR